MNSFKEIILNNDIFFDKSLFINEILNCKGKVIIITMPRIWCKSTNIGMLKNFLEINIDKEGN